MKILALPLMALIGCGVAIHIQTQHRERESFLHEDPWSWMPKSELGFAAPIVSPRGALHPTINQWAFQLDYPAGFAEYQVIAQVCIYGPSKTKDCQTAR